MHKGILWFALLYTVLSTLLSSIYPVLDEESYLYIGRSMSFANPYDWELPWPPYTDSYRYAHPPLFLFWVRMGTMLFSDGSWVLKLFLGVPFRLLLGGAAGWLLYHQGGKKWSTLAMWICSPIVLMVGARSAMPDLMLCALGTTSMALFLSSEERRYRILCGVCLGLACWVKYPALLLWVPLIFASHSWRGVWPILCGFFCTWGIGELWLWGVYGEWHLQVVLSTADHVGRGPLIGRVNGFLMRLVVGIPSLILLIHWKRIPWMVAIMIPLLWSLPALSTMGCAVALIWISLSVVGIGVCVRRMDFFAVWWLTIFVGVCVTHNFSSPRYLVLGMVPLVILLTRAISEQGTRAYLVWGGIGLSLLMGIAIAHKEHEHAQETLNLIKRLPATESMHYSGEWTFRWGMREKGGVMWKGGQEVVVQPKQAVGGSIPKNFQRVEVFTGKEGRRLLLDREHSVGYYSETLGFWPFGVHNGPIEELSVWKFER
jgi:hypothetical protein